MNHLCFFFHFHVLICTNISLISIIANSDLLFKDYQNDHKFTITTYTSTGVVRFYLFFYLSLKYIFLFKFDYGKCFVFVFRYSLFFKKKSLLFVHFLETLSGGAFRIIELEALLIVLFFFFLEWLMWIWKWFKKQVEVFSFVINVTLLLSLNCGFSGFL